MSTPGRPRNPTIERNIGQFLSYDQSIKVLFFAFFEVSNLFE
jgi:hypothetical protein